MSTAANRAVSAPGILNRTVAAYCVGASPTHGALARLGEHGVHWQGEAADAELVWATVPQHGNARSAVQLARRLGKPLVLDFASSWALDARVVHPTALHLHTARRGMRAALHAAALVLVRTPDLAAACRELGAAPERVLTVPEGCEAGAQLPPTTGNGFTIWVASHLQPSVHPPCATHDGVFDRRVRPIEPVGATAYYLFSALAALRQKVPALFARLRVQFAHELDRTNLDIAHWLEVESVFVDGAGRPDATDAVFVCQHGECGGARTYDDADGFWAALATGRPLLAALPAGAGRDLVQAFGFGLKVPATDAPPLCHAIERLVAQKDAGAPATGATAAWIERHGAEPIAAAVADALRALCGGGALPTAAQSLWPTTGATAS